MLVNTDQVSKSLILCIALFTGLMLSGCSFTPQKTNIDPEIRISGEVVGHGRSMALKLEDERPSQSIGRRGTGAMLGAEIVPAQDVGTVFRQEIADGLEQRGFNVVPYSDDHSLRMVVELRELKYSTSMGFWTGGVHMNASMKVKAFRENEDYEEFYRAEEEERVFFVNFADENDELINAVASKLIQQLFDDQNLSTFLGD
jgi:uncharacterized lipoprotein YajG